MILTKEQINQKSIESGRKYVLCIDFDRTLCKSKFPRCGEPIKPILDYILYIQDANVDIILWTCREGESLQLAKDWCKEYGIKICCVNKQAPYDKNKWNDTRKVFCDCLIDDCSYDFDVNDFKQFMEGVK